MYSFLVLGYLPGTHLQITFQDWLNFAGVVVCLVLLDLAFNLRRRFSRRSVSNVSTAMLGRVTLYASQLHQRA